MRSWPRYLALPVFLAVLAGCILLGLSGCESKTKRLDEPDVECQFLVTIPGAGDVGVGEEIAYIQWASQGAGDEVTIELHKGPVLVMVIRASTPNDGSTSWTVTTNGFATGSDYRIRVADAADPECGAFSNYFTLVNPAECEIEVTSPNSHSGWMRDDEEQIVWTSNSTSGRVRLELWSGPQFAGEIHWDTEDDGVLIWPVTSYNQGSGPGYRIKVVDRTISSCYGWSESFYITDPWPCSITLTSPVADDIWTEGTEKIISWEHEYASGLLIIDLYRGIFKVDQIAVTENDSIYHWEVTTFGEPYGGGYHIVITDLYDRYCDGFSEGFYIVEPLE